MLPKTGNLLEKTWKIVQQPSKTFCIKDDRVMGYVDELDAVKQAVYCILNTERYDWIIYSWNYGVELKGLFGKPIELVKSKLKKRIKEALQQDDRIKRVDGFSFEETGRKLAVSFTVHTIFGEVQAEKEVNIHV